MIVIPMAGLSRRFADAGYRVPKYMLSAHGQSIFSHAVRSFAAYFDTVPFLFVVRDIADTPKFVDKECRRLGLANFQVVVLRETTRGQAETVEHGLAHAPVSADAPVTIFNIDTIRPNFSLMSFTGRSDGYLEVFRGTGANWSYVRPAASGSDVVAETAEKHAISNLCCTGIYHFASARLFHTAYAEYLTNFDHSSRLKELYVAPLYNVLISLGQVIRYTIIDQSEVIFCGVPDEYENFKRNGELLPWDGTNANGGQPLR